MKKTEKTSARVAKVAARLVKLRSAWVYVGMDHRTIRSFAQYSIGDVTYDLIRDIRLVAASALTQAPDRKR